MKEANANVALKLALEALEPEPYLAEWYVNEHVIPVAITAIKEALAQPEEQHSCDKQEPVTHLWECLGTWSAYLVTNGEQANCAPPSWLVEAVRNATNPPQRTWVGLTWDDISNEDAGNLDFYQGAKWAEAKLKEKNT